MAKRLTDGPRLTVAVDTAVFTLPSGADTLSVLQVRRDGGRGWALPGASLRGDERLVDAVLRSLRERAGVEGLRPRQVHVFDDPAHDENGRVLSVAHVMVVRYERLATRASATRLMPVGAPGQLSHGHGEIIALALADVRRRYAALPDPDGLLPPTFTVHDLRHVHGAVAAEALQKDTFRRAMDPYLVGTGRLTSGSRGRPAELFARS